MGYRGAMLILLIILCSPIVALPNIETVKATEDSWISKSPMQVARDRLGVAVVYFKPAKRKGAPKPSGNN